MKTFELNNKQHIPAVGFGVFMIPNDGPTYDATLAALKAGYRLNYGYRIMDMKMRKKGLKIH